MSDESATHHTFLTNKDIAADLKTCVRTVERMQADGRLPRPHRFGERIKRTASNAYEAAKRRAFTKNATG
jgi:hypothetical protein